MVLNIIVVVAPVPIAADPAMVLRVADNRDRIPFGGHLTAADLRKISLADKRYYKL